MKETTLQPGICCGLLAPHLPLLLEEEEVEGGGSLQAALREVGGAWRAAGIEVVVAASSHWQPRAPFRVDTAARHRLGLRLHEGPPDFDYGCPGDPGLGEALLSTGDTAGLPVAETRRGLDDALAVPLHFLFPGGEMPVVPISVSQQEYRDCLKWGESLDRAATEAGRRAAFLITGVLSHDMTAFLFGMGLPETRRFDEEVLGLLEAGEGLRVLDLDPGLLEAAKPEGEFRDLYILLGALGTRPRARVLAYREEPGVGLGVVEFLR